MKINVFSIVWNEQFMLPHFLKHYEQFADKIFIVDDHSTDKTAEIAKAHPLVEYSEYGFDGLAEDEFNDTFASMVKFNQTEDSSEWAMCVDGDEFISHPDMRTYLAGQSGILKTKGYMMIGKTGKLEDCKPIRMKTFDKPVVFQPSLGIVYFGDGRHSVNFPAKESELELLHYKYSSREYYLERNKLSYPRIMNAKDTEYRLKRGLDYYDRHIS